MRRAAHALSAQTQGAVQVTRQQVARSPAQLETLPPAKSLPDLPAPDVLVLLAVAAWIWGGESCGQNRDKRRARQ